MRGFLPSLWHIAEKGRSRNGNALKFYNPLDFPVVEAMPLIQIGCMMACRVYEEEREKQPVNPIKDGKPGRFICRFAAVFSNTNRKQHQKYVNKLIDS